MGGILNYVDKNRIKWPMDTILEALEKTIASRKTLAIDEQKRSYVAELFAAGDDAILKKIGEEATELVMAAKDARMLHHTDKIVYECADLWFHCLIMLGHYNVPLQTVLDELARRAGTSGIEEKASRKKAARTALEALKDQS